MFWWAERPRHSLIVRRTRDRCRELERLRGPMIAVRRCYLDADARFDRQVRRRQTRLVSTCSLPGSPPVRGRQCRGSCVKPVLLNTPVSRQDRSPFGVVIPGIGVQSVGFVVTGGGVVPEVDVAGRQTCHVTVAARRPRRSRRIAPSCSAARSPARADGDPTGVEFPPQPAAQAASSTSAPNTPRSHLLSSDNFHSASDSASTTAAARFFSRRSPLLARC